jgi:hypothetical protein
VEQERRIVLLVGAGGGVLVAAGSLLPWITATAPFVGTISRSGVDMGSDGVALLIGGIAVAVALAFVAFSDVAPSVDQGIAVAGLIAGVGGGWLAWSDKKELESRVAGLAGELAANVGAGVWLVLVGCGLLVFAMIRVLVRPNEEHKDAEPPPTPPTPPSTTL